MPPQACHSRCSVTHPIGDHNHRSYFFRIRYLLLEWSGQLIFLGLSLLIRPLKIAYSAEVRLPAARHQNTAVATLQPVLITQSAGRHI
jgi:hypothetical protein